MVPKISEVERLILANQFRLLATTTLNDEDKQSFARRAEILERGYIQNYSDALGPVCEWKEFPEDQSQYVLQVLDMFTAIRNAREDGVAFPEDPRKALVYSGFEDAGQSLYARFLIEEMSRYVWLVDPRWNLPTNWRYRLMLSVWKARGGSMTMTTDDLTALVASVEAIE